MPNIEEIAQQEHKAQQQQLATARPQIVITVQVGGQNQIYDLETAKALRQELDNAIQSIEAPPPPAPPKKRATRKKPSKKSRR